MNERLRAWAAFGALLVGLSVILGAFGAHVLRESLEPSLLIVYERSVYYQLLHGLALIVVSGLSHSGMLEERSAVRVCRLFAIGTLIFCGSLYLYVFTGVREFGAITPIGGISFICGWFLLAFFLRRR